MGETVGKCLRVTRAGLEPINVGDVGQVAIHSERIALILCMSAEKSKKGKKECGICKRMIDFSLGTSKRKKKITLTYKYPAVEKSPA